MTYNNVAHTAAYASSTQLTISLSASDQATVGSYAVVVTNPAPGGGASNSMNLAVTLSIKISPTSASVPVFHTAQFTAAVSGVSNTAVTWSVNGTTGGTLAAGEISSGGLYTAPNVAPSSGMVTVSATSQADSTQKASATVTITADTTPPSVISVSPASGASGVSQTAAISAQFSEELDPATVNSQNVALSNGTTALPALASYDPTSNTINLIPQGILEAGTTYTVSIGAGVSGLAENQLGTAYVWSFTTQSAATANVSISVPSGMDPTTLTVLSFGGQEVAPDSQGNASASLRPYGTTLVAAMFPGQPFGFLALTIGGIPGQAATSVAAQRIPLRVRPTVHTTRWQITASPQAATQPAAVTVDFQTTAESLLFLTWPLMNPNPAKAQVIMAAIAADPSTASLAQALSAASSEAQPLSDSAVQTAMQNAVVSILTTLTGGPNAQANEQARTAATGAKFRHELRVHPEASTQSSQPAQISTTPNCGSGSTPTSGGLPCLDLDYISLHATNSPDSNGNYEVNTNNCTNSSILGCATGWLAQVAPLANVPSGGIGSITPGQGSNGPDSPVDPSGDPLMPASCTPPTSVSGCTSVFWVPPSSNFQYVDVTNDIALGVEDLVNLATGQATQVGFGIPASTQRSYIARFYSGGFADTIELSNVFGGSYNGGVPLWSSALAVNALTDVENALNGAGVLPDGLLSCMTQQVVTTQLIGQVSQLQQGLSNPSTDVGLLLLSTINQISGDFEGAAVQCVSDQASQSLVKFLFGIGEQAAKWVSVIPQILTAVSDAGQVTQQLVEMKYYATAVETALASVGNPAPQAASIQLTCPDASMQVNQQETCTAAAFDAQNNPIPASQAGLQWSWVSSPASGTGSVINVLNTNSGAAQVVAVAPGNATIVVTAPRTSGGPFVYKDFALTIDQAPLASITITPPTVTEATGTIWQLVVQGFDAQENPEPLGAITWTTSASAVATIGAWPGLPNAGQLQLVAPGTAIMTASVGSFSATVSVTVTGSGVANPVPSITSLSPSSLTVGASPQNLTINGTGFISTSAVTFNGIARIATYVSSTQLTISLTADDLATADSFPVVVTNPAPGGGPSNSVNFTVLAGGSQGTTEMLVADSSGQLWKTEGLSDDAIWIGSLPVVMSDIAAYNGKLYGVSNPPAGSSSTLYSIDPNTGSGAAIGSDTGAPLDALAFSPSGTLYAAEADNLYTVDTDTGTATLVGSGSGAGSYASFGDLEFDSSGNLYLTSNSGNGDQLFTIDPTTGQGTLIGSIGYSGVYGLAYFKGIMYGFTGSGSVITINLSTGAGTLVFAYNLGFDGATAISPPATTPQTLLTDTFSEDSALNTSLWSSNTTLLLGIAEYTGFFTNATYEQPVLSFSNLGMSMSGANNYYEFTGIQSNTALTPPFTVQTTVEATVDYACAFQFYVISGDQSESVFFTANLAPASGFYGFGVNLGPVDGGGYSSYNMDNNGTINTWYVLGFKFDGRGYGEATLNDTSGNRIGWTLPFSIGNGPFYLVLAQYEGGPDVAGPNTAIWQSISATNP